MKRFVVRFLAGVGALTVVLVIVLIVSLSSGGPEVPDSALLVLDLRKPIPEVVPEDPVARITNKDAATLHGMVDAIHRAAGDDRVVGLFARVDSAPIGLAQLQDLREAVRAFRASGKPTVAFAETIGGIIPENGAYFAATAFDEIVVQRSGHIGLLGLAAEVPFFKGSLDKLGLEPRFSKREAYKTAPNIFTEEGFTDAHREEVTSRLNTRFDMIVSGIAEARGLPEADVRAFASRGPLAADEALEAGLIDRVAYQDEAASRLMTEGTKRISVSKYAAILADDLSGSGKGVALVYAVGTIMSGSSQFDPVSGDQTAGSDTVIEAFDKALRDDDVGAVVFRVDSPGGSYVASDAIWRATRRANLAGKPIIVSMGNVAASGGYLVATHADRIVAQPGTVTGSIGVFGGKFLTRDMWTKLGVNWGEVATDERARFASSLSDFSPDQQAAFERYLDEIYAAFTTQVSEGRVMTAEATQAAAQGRVWLGVEALERGLVDEMGSLRDAIGIARREAGLSDDAPVRVFPKKRTLLELVLEEGLGGATTAFASATLDRVRGILRPVAMLARLVSGSATPLTEMPAW